MERYLRVNLLGPGPPLMKKRIYPASVTQRLRNTAVVRRRSWHPVSSSLVVSVHSLHVEQQ